MTAPAANTAASVLLFLWAKKRKYINTTNVTKLLPWQFDFCNRKSKNTYV